MLQNLNMTKGKGKWRFVWIAFLVLTILLAACQSEPTATEEPQPATEAPPAEPAPTQAPDEPAPAADTPSGLTGVEWVLIAYGDALNPVVIEPGTRPTAVFGTDGSLSGSGSCNNFNTTYQVDGEQISFGPAASTMMACEIGMEQESAYLAAFESANSFEIVSAGLPYTQRLLINYDSGKGYPEQLVYDAEIPLVDTQWILVSYGDANDPTPTQTGVVSTAVFAADGTLSGSGGCNSYGAGYSAQDVQISIGTPETTLMACEQGMEQEQAYLAALEMAETYRLGNGYLEITYASGAAVLRFSARHMPLENVRWVLTLIDGQPLPAGVEAFVVFTPATEGQEAQVNGNAGCNGFFGAYSIENGAITAGPFGATQMMCTDDVMQVEQAFLAGLESVQSYETILKQLTLTTSSGSLIFYADRMPLEGPTWTLTSLGDVDSPRAPIPESNFTANFARQFGMPSGWMSGTTGCNDYNSTFYSNLEEIKVNLPGLLSNTCSDAMLEEEQAFFLGLNSARDYRIIGNELHVTYGNQALVFQGAYPPAEGEVGPLAVLHGSQWQLFSIDSFQVIPDSVVTAGFTINPDGLTGQISGSGGCNTYNAEITGVFTVGPATATQALCDTPEGIMEQESTYLSALQVARSFELESGTLSINTDLGVLVFNTPQAVQPLPTPEATSTPEGGQPLPPTETPETVEPQPLTAVISAPTEGQANQAITFDGSVSTPAEGIVSYQWDFGDGSAPVEGVSAEHTFAAAGVYTVTLTITDGDGNTAAATLEVTIS